MSDKCAYPKCGKELIHVVGRKKKKYCDATCKLADWQRLNPVKKQPKVKMVDIVKADKFEKELELALKESGIEIKKSIWDMIEFGVSITKTTPEGEIKRVNPMSEEGIAVQFNAQHIDSHIQTLEFPTDFNGLLSMAKKGVDNVEAFKMAVAASKCNSNQKSMVLSKLNQQ